jgi:hypothetical protein
LDGATAPFLIKIKEDLMIEKMINEELERACYKNGSFASMAEAYGVIKEEFEEAKEEMIEIERALDDYWGQCRMSPNHCGVSEILDIFGDRVQKCIMELVQLGAMVKKARGLEVMNPKEKYEHIKREFNKKGMVYAKKYISLDSMSRFDEYKPYYIIILGIKGYKVYPDMNGENIGYIISRLRHDIKLIVNYLPEKGGIE